MTETTCQPTIRLEATDRTPAVSFDFGTRRLSISGESYPEDAASFYGPLLQALEGYLADPAAEQTVLELQMVYFNSSTAKALMNIFQMLENAARRGTPVTINWRHHVDDDIMREFGEDFMQDFEYARFVLCPESGSHS